MSTVAEVCRWLEQVAPLAQQESYDNAGLIVGDSSAVVKGVLTCLDVTEEVLAEALEKGCNLIVAHHPIVFRGLKRLTGSTYVERCVAMALRNDLALYAIHTNLDNALYRGVNEAIAKRLGLQNTRILAPRPERLRVEIRAKGAVGDRAVEGLLRPYGSLRKQEQLEGDELVHLWVTEVSVSRKGEILSAFRQMDPAYGISFLRMEEEDPFCGAGLLGELAQPMLAEDFLDFLKQRMKTDCVRHTRLPKGKIQSVALCGGAGSFLLGKAMAAAADVFLSADFKYHEFFDADGRILIADIGHYESEQFTIELLRELIAEKFVTFAAHCTEVRTNPVFYR